MLDAQQLQWMSLAILAVLAGIFVWRMQRVYRAYHVSPAQFPIYMFSYLMTRILWRTTIEGRLPFGPGQGAVIVSNHVGPVDPAFIALATGRPVHWLVAKEYVTNLAYAWAFKILEVIPVNRGGIDTAATKMGVRFAARGDLVGLFPEGRINTTEKLLLPGRPGAALIALRAKVPVVPCYVSGSPYDGTAWGFFFMSAKVHVIIGKPIDMSEYYECHADKELLETITRRFLVEIAKLAGAPHYQPEVAGRQWKSAAVG